MEELKNVASMICFEILPLKEPTKMHFFMFMGMWTLFHGQQHFDSQSLIVALVKYISTYKHIRSLYCFAQYNERVEMELLTLIHESFKFIRVMHIDGANISELPGGIGDLIHLKYLLVKVTGAVPLEKLPSTLNKLYNLQTLSIRGYINSHLHIPDVWRMKQMRHIRLENGAFLQGSKHLQLDQLTNLQTFSSIWVGDWAMNDLGKLTTLRTMGLRGDLISFEKTLSDSIAKLKNLRSLWLNNPDLGLIPISIPWSNLPYLETLYLFGRLEKLPAMEEFPSSFTKLVLKWTELVEDPMPVLEKLPNLKYLKFSVDGYSGEKMSCSAAGFPKLGFLQIGGCMRLEEWTIEEGALANLRFLEIYRCHKLKMVPEGLRHLTALQELLVSEQPHFFRQRVGKDGEDYSKIQHVPYVSIH